MQNKNNHENEKSRVPEQEPAPDTAPAQQEPAEEKNEHELLLEKYNELQDKYLRVIAEYDNFRKRSLREKDESYTNATAAAITKLLPIQDNFQRAMGYDPASEDFAKGFSLIAESFSALLESFGAVAFGEDGEPFDPEKHHAVMHIEDESLGENVVAKVLQKGYKMGDKILRYAMVQAAN